MGTLVEMKGVVKKFPGVTALKDISFDIRAGEVHVLLGENGAGKSTLMKILSGVYQPTEGTIVIGGKSFSKLSPKDSTENGISVIYQELSVINELSIQENLFVGKLPMKKYGPPEFGAGKHLNVVFHALKLVKTEGQSLGKAELEGINKGINIQNQKSDDGRSYHDVAPNHL